MEIWKEFDHNVVSHSAAHHLMAVDDLMQRFGYARVSDVARALNITRGSVSISIRPHIEAGLILQDENHHLRLSPTGQALVDGIKTKRMLMQRLFHEVLGVPPVQAEIDACKLEHLLSNETAQRLVSFTRFLDSRHPAVLALKAAWASSEKECAHSPAACPSCETSCMAETVKTG